MFIYARLVTQASKRLWLHWPMYVHMRLYQLLCMCVRGWVWNFINRIRDKTGYCKTSQQSWPLFSEWQMMTIQKQFRGDVGSGRRSKAISPTVLSVGEHNCALNDTHRPACVNTRTKTHPLKPLTCASVMLLKSAKMAHPPSCIQSFLSTWFILSFSPAVTSRKHDRQIWTELIGLNISVVGILIWWIVTRKADSWSGKQIGKNLESTELCSLRAPLCL